MPEILQFYLIPTYYSTNRQNVTTSLPGNDGQRASAHRVRSITLDEEGSIYIYEVNDKLPDKDRVIKIQNKLYSAKYAYFYRPKNSEKQKWVAAYSHLLEKKGNH